MSEPIPFDATITPVFLQGNAVRLEGVFTTHSGAPVPVNAVRLIALPPAGNATNIPLTDESGVAVGAVLLNIPGMWTFRFEGVGPYNVAVETRIVTTPRGVPEVV